MNVGEAKEIEEGATRVLLSNAVDYAGLFPPAALSMAEAVSNYSAYLASEDAWALGRFVVPVSRLQELEAAAFQLARGTRWRVAALASGDNASDAHRVSAFNRAPAAQMVIDVLEAKANRPDELELLRAAFPDMPIYVELVPNDSLEPMVAAVGSAGLRAKIRTGGVVAGAFPSSRDVARFILACVRHAVPFKATAGLHHPLRGDYALTYSDDSERGMMFGFVNVFVATALAFEGGDEHALVSVLEAAGAAHPLVEGKHVRLGDTRVTVSAVARARRDGVVSFGSCSFREPIDELFALTAQR